MPLHKGLNSYQPLTDVLVPRPAGRTAAALRDTLLTVGGSLLVALTAQISIPLPFTPVPITGQTFGVLLVGMLLGSRRGWLALALYLLEGAVGLPFFAQHKAGIDILFGSTAGYLFAFPVAAYVMGRLAERGWDRTPLRMAASMLLGGAIIMALGTLWLAHLVGGIQSAFLLGCVPFLLGDLIKTALAAGLMPVGWRLLRDR